MTGTTSAETTVSSAPPRGAASRPADRLVIVATVIVATVVVLLAPIVVAFGPALPGREEADLTTSLFAALLGLAVAASATVCLAAIVALTWLLPTTSPGLTRSGTDLRELARRCATWWCVSSATLVLVNAADAPGYPLSYALIDPVTMVAGAPTAQAWLVTAIGALVARLLLAGRFSWGRGVQVSALLVLLAIPTVVTNRVSVGANHDLATDAATIFTVISVPWLALAIARSLVPNDATVARRRLLLLPLATVLIAVPARLGVAGYELARTPWWSSAYGLALVLLAVLIVVVLVTTLLPTARSGVGRVRLFAVVVLLACQVAMAQLIPPAFLVPQTTQENLLGFDVPTAPTLSTMWWPGRPNLLLSVIAVAAIIAYLAAWLRMRSRGDAWPTVRVVSWVAGWLVVLMITATRVWAYSSAMFSWHMAAHMTLNMLAPPLLVLGGTITLTLRALRPGRPDRPGPREAVMALTNSGLARGLSHPLVLWVIFVSGFYVLYFSPLFGEAMRFHWAHQLMTFHFLIIGYLFYAVAIGVDRPPRDVPQVARLAVVFAAMPFHAFFAIAVMAGGSEIGSNFYRSLGVSWMHDLAADQQLGGQIAWATGELPLLVVIISLVAQWFRQDQRTARRRDRALDHNDEMAAYNDMLAELARRDGSEAAP